MKTVENLGTTYEDGFGRIEWYLDLDTKSTFCIPEISDTYRDFCKQITDASVIIENSMEIK